tara:strand:+ start:4593 stop:5729 length:1137 start_codon:yes stop_codon:yes gene_type:complete
MTHHLSLLLLLILSSCASSTNASNSSLAFSSASEIEVMAWNVENLFDTKHDEGKNDWTFVAAKTPGKNDACAKVSYKRYRDECFETDWNDEKLETKLNQIKEVLTRDRSALPDVLALSEIENENVISILAKKLGYTAFAVSDSPDERGVDLAILWNEVKLKKVAKREHVIKSKALEGRFTRNILEVEFVVAGKHPLTVFVNHWPSQGNKNETRIDAAKVMMDRVKQIQKKNSKMAILATGDFNVIDTNRPDPFFSVVEKGGLSDVHSLYMESKDVDYRVKVTYPLGTYFYGKKMQWNLLDRFFVSKNLVAKSGLRAEITSYQIYAPKFITDTYEYTYKTDHHAGSHVTGIPKRYEHNTSRSSKAGYSDHFPIILKLKY